MMENVVEEISIYGIIIQECSKLNPFCCNFPNRVEWESIPLSRKEISR